VTPAPDRIVDVAAAVADGLDVDWAAESSSIPGEVDALRDLKIIAEIAAVHRRLSGEDSSMADASRAPAAPAAIDPRSQDGTPWGPLRILEPVGSGSFGEVFRAWDTRLERVVALKILRSRRTTGTGDAILREGQLLARINHPNVMAVYGAQEVDGRVGIWGEFLSGRTLAAIVTQEGTLSANEALVFGEAVCRALAAAHRAGLLHRDVKAQNVIRERGGRIVLMDFGLGRELSDQPATASPDLAGTPLYMAPELFTGGHVSVQSDIYSVGVLLFFLVTGAFPVQGASLSEIRAAHAAGRSKRLQDLRPDVPPSFARVVERALEPQPQQRFDSAGAMLASMAAASQPIPERRDADSKSLSRTGAIVMGVVTALALAIAAGAIWINRTSRPAAGSPITFPLPPPVGTYYPDSSWNVPAVSPDGESLAFLTRNVISGAGSLWVRSLRTMELREIVKNDHPFDPFWSPDGKSLGFFSARGLQTTTLAGPPADKAYTALESRGGTWNSQGVILYAKDPPSGLFRVTSGDPSAEPTLVIAPNRAAGELGYLWPQFLPDGDRFVYFVLSNDTAVRGVYVGSLTRGRGVRLVRSDASGLFAQGQLLTVSAGALVAWPFDAATGRITGTSTVVVPSVGVTFDHRVVASAADAGPLVYSPPELSRLTWLDRSGREAGVVGEKALRYRSPALSRDGRYLAVQRYTDGWSRIDVLDLRKDGTLTTIIPAAATEGRTQTPEVQFALWGPGNDLAYAATDAGWLDIYTMQVGADRPPRLLCQTPSDKMPTDWSNDGHALYYNDLATSEMWRLDLSAGTPCPGVRVSSATKAWGRLSPDGGWIAYVSQEAGIAQVWVRDTNDRSPVRVSTAGGTDPAWSTSTELSFLDRLGRFHLVDVSRLSAQIARETSSFPTLILTPGAARNNYAWDPAGRKVLLNQPQPDQLETRIAAVTNWAPGR